MDIKHVLSCNPLQPAYTTVNVGEVLAALREVKFKGMISIEYEANADEPTEDVKACVAVFKEAAKKKA